MSLCCDCYVLSNRGICVGLITHPEESYRLCCFSECDLQNFVNEEALAHWGPLRQIKKALCVLSFKKPLICTLLKHLVKVKILYFLVTWFSSASSFFRHYILTFFL